MGHGQLRVHHSSASTSSPRNEYLRGISSLLGVLITAKQSQKRLTIPSEAKSAKMVSQSLFLLFPALALASITIEDPSDVIKPKWWTKDNALLADYNIAMISTQPSNSESLSSQS
jgi:hypothetical protein